MLLNLNFPFVNVATRKFQSIHMIAIIFLLGSGGLKFCTRSQVSDIIDANKMSD